MTKAKEKQGLVLLTIFILKRLSYANERSFSSETLYGLKYINKNQSVATHGHIC